MENTVDVLPSLLQVLGTTEDAAFVLGLALITQGDAIGDREMSLASHANQGHEE